MTAAQTTMLAIAMTPNIYTLLRLFAPWRGGNDRPMDWQSLHQKYHSVYEDPDRRPKTQWSERRLERALEDAVAAGLVEWQEQPWLEGWKWVITPAGVEAREVESKRRESK